MTKPTIGFVGLGHMGGAMTTRLLAAGYTVSGTSRSRGRAASLEAAGMRWYDTAREVTEHSAVVLSSLPDDTTVTEVGEEIIAGLGSGRSWVDLSTISPGTSRDLAARVAEHGGLMLDAPVSGSVPQVRSGTLTIMVGGDQAGYAQVEPILRELGTPTLVGGNGQGLALKLAINISLAVQMIALSEGLLLADRSGVDRSVALRLMTDSPIGSPMLKARAPLVLNLPDDAWFDISLMHKDIKLAMATGRQLATPLPTADRADEILTTAEKLGFAHRDIAGVFQVLRQMAHEGS